MSWNMPSDKDRVECAIARGHTPETAALLLRLPLDAVVKIIEAMERVNSIPDEEHHGNVRTGAA